MLFLSIWTIVANMLLAVLQELIAMYVWKMNIILYTVHWIILVLLKSFILFCFDLYYCSGYIIGCFIRSIIFVWLLNSCYLKYSSLIDFLLAFICMLFWSIRIIVAGMFVAVFTRSDFFVCLWNYYYYTFSSLIDALLSLICMLFLFVWTILARMFVVVFISNELFVW